MSQINQLSAIDTVAGGDLFALWATGNGDTRKLSVSVLLEYIQDNIDNIKEYADFASFPATGETEKIYIATDTNLIYNWNGSAYVKLGVVVLDDLEDVDTTGKADGDFFIFNGTSEEWEARSSLDLGDIATGNQLQLRSDTTANHATFTGAEGEVTVDTDKNTAVVHDGSTAGGIPLTKQSDTDLKAPIADPTFTGTVGGITKAMVGLGNADNTSDADKPVSTAQQTALDLKSNLASPTFTGVPAAPTAGFGTDTTQIATTAFVIANTSGADTRLNTADEDYAGQAADVEILNNNAGEWIQNQASAWVSFEDTGTAVILDSYNVASVVRASTGVYDITFAVAMDDITYGVASNGAYAASSPAIAGGVTASKAVGSYQIRVMNVGSTLVDAIDCGVVFFGGRS